MKLGLFVPLTAPVATPDFVPSPVDFPKAPSPQAGARRRAQ